MNKRIKLIVTGALACMMLVGCSSPKSTDKTAEGDKPTTEETANSNNPATKRNTKDNLVIAAGVSQMQGQFLPIFQDTSADGTPMAILFRGLLMSNAEGKYVPDLAKDLKISDDKLTYTFTLRDDVKWHDGKPVTAQDVEFTYLATADPSYDGWHNDTVLNTVGYKAYNEDKENKLTSMEGIKVIDEKTISFTFEKVLRNSDEFLTLGIMPKHIYDKGKGQLAETRKVQDAQTFIGTGPYKFVKFDPKQFVELEANKDFYLGAPKINTLILKDVPRESAANELNIGEVDVYPSYPTKEDDIALIRDTKFLDIKTYDGTSFGYIGFNLDNPKFKDKEVRQALDYALDKASFVKSYFRDYADVAMSPIPTKSWAMTEALTKELNAYAYNPDKANKMLDEAGWKKGADGIREKDGVKLEINHWSYTGSKYVETLLPILKANWEAVGCKVNTELMEFGVLVSKTGKTLNDDGTPAFDTFNMAWGLGGFDPNGCNWMFRSQYAVDDGNNKMRYKNDKVDEAFDQGLVEFDNAKLQKIYGTMAKQLNEDCPVIFMDCSKSIEVVNQRVKNWNTSEMVGWTSIIHEVELGD